MNAIRLSLTVAALVAASPALAQETPAPATTSVLAAVDLSCGDISTLEAAHAAALVYYVAGYVDGQRDAGSPPPPAADNGMVGGITLSAAAVIDACVADPTALIRDKIATLGGSSAPASAAGTPPPVEQPAPAEEPAPTEETMPPAAETTEPAPQETPAPEGETPAPAPQ